MLRLIRLKKLLILGALAVVSLLFGTLLQHDTVHAANPNLINFQGKVVNSDGTNVTNGTYTFRFRLYTSTAPTDAGVACGGGTATCKWEESKSVTVTNGVFQTELGDTTTMIDVSLYTNLYLGILFNSDPAGEMSPRVHLDSAPYALNSDKLGGIAASGFVQLGATQSGNINIGTGTITSGNVNGQTISSTANFTGTVTIQGSNALVLGVASSTPGAVVFRTSGANSITLQGPTSNPTSSYALKLPTGAPSLSQCLQNDGTTIGQLTFASCDPNPAGDSISVNGTAATDANFLNTTATGTATGVTWALSTGSTPDDVTASISNASTTQAGSITTGSQTFAGDKAFQSTAGNSATAFSVQNAAGTSILNIDTTDTNLITNPGFEVNNTGWVAASTTAPTRVTTSKYLGFGAGAVTSVTTAGEGFKQVLAATLANGTYTISWYDKLVSGPAFTDVMAALSTAGGAPVNCTGINTQTVVSTGWTRHWCTVTAASDTAANYITIRQVAASTSRTWNIDAVQLELGATPSAYGAGAISINSNITSPINFRNVEDSTTAFQIQTANGTNLATFDTVNQGLTLAGNITLNTQTDLRFADSDSSNYVAFQAAATVASNVTWTLPSADAAGCLQSNGTGTLSFAACGDTNIQTFAATGTYSKPANALMVIIEAWGAGGGGGGGTGNSLAATRSGGGGGGGGAYNTTTIAASSLGATVPVTIGAGGTAGTGGTTAVGTNGGVGGATCFSTTTACAGTMYLEAFGGGGGAGTGTAGNGGGAGGGTQSAGAVAATATGGTGGSPLGSTAGLLNSGSGGAGGATSATTAAAGGSSNWGGGGGGASTTAGGNASGDGGGSNQGGAGGAAGGSCAVTTCTLRAGGAGGHVPGLSGGGGTAGSTAGTAGGAGAAGVGSGGDGGGGGATITTSGGTGGTGGVGGARGGGGGGGGASANSGTQHGGAGGAGGAGYLRTWTLRGAGADLAEIYCTNDSSLIAGDAVAIDPALKAGVQKTVRAYDPDAIGIISTDPGLTMGKTEEDCAKPVLVALAGRVPLAVSLENGPIRPGDELTASSTPGVAMKAVKAGTVIGQALTGYDGSMPSAYVVAFAQNHQSNGSALIDLIPGLSNDSEVPVSQQALEYLVANKDKAIANQYVSEITTDRLTAGLEIISPSVVTDALTTNSIGSSGGGDISFILNDQNKLVVKGKSGAPGFTVDATGNATFGVSLTSLGDIESKGGLVVNGDALFGGNATFSKLAQFEGTATFNKSAGGLAVIPTGAARVNIIFDKPYDSRPVVGISLLADQTVLPDGTIEDPLLKEQRLLTSGYSYLISNSTPKGFTIVLNKKATEDLQFNWNAVAIKDLTTTRGTVEADSNAQPASAEIAAGGQ